MSDASQSLLERITEALAKLDGYPTAWRDDDDIWPALRRDAEAVLVVVGERDAEIRQHLERAISYERHDDGIAAIETLEAALALLTPDEQDTP